MPSLSVAAETESNERKGGTRHTSGVAQREREQKQDVGVSLIQHIDYILRDTSCLGYLRITAMKKVKDP